MKAYRQRKGVLGDVWEKGEVGQEVGQDRARLYLSGSWLGCILDHPSLLCIPRSFCSSCTEGDLLNLLNLCI